MMDTSDKDLLCMLAEIDDLRIRAETIGDARVTLFLRCAWQLLDQRRRRRRERGVQVELCRA